MMEWMYIADYLLLGALMVMMAIGVAFSAFMPAPSLCLQHADEYLLHDRR